MYDKFLGLNRTVLLYAYNEIIRIYTPILEEKRLKQ